MFKFNLEANPVLNSCCWFQDDNDVSVNIHGNDQHNSSNLYYNQVNLSMKFYKCNFKKGLPKTGRWLSSQLFKPAWCFCF